MEAQEAVWKDFQDLPYYGNFKRKFGRNADGILSGLKAHYSNDGGFDGFFNDCFRLEVEEHMSDDQILEIMREKAEESLFKTEMAELAKSRGMGEKGLASILGGVYMENGDRQKHLMHNYLELIEEGADRQKIENLIMERYAPNYMKLEESGEYNPEIDNPIMETDGPKEPGNGSSWWGKLRKYGKKPVALASAAVLVAAAIGIYYCTKPERHEQKAAKPAITEEFRKPAVPAPPEKAYKACFGGWGETTAILPMPGGSHRESKGNYEGKENYEVVLPAEIIKGEDGSVRARIKQDVRPIKGTKVDKVGIRMGNRWFYANPGEARTNGILVEFTPGELGNYLTGEGVDFQAAAFRRLHYDEKRGCEILQSIASYRKAKLVKP
jgi:hypothetical protein